MNFGLSGSTQYDRKKKVGVSEMMISMGNK
jgi:hypothetical protein